MFNMRGRGGGMKGGRGGGAGRAMGGHKMLQNKIMTGRQAGKGGAVGVGVQHVTLQSNFANRSTPYQQKTQQMNYQMQQKKHHQGFQQQQQQQQQQRGYKNTIYVANIPQDWDENDILRVFVTVGTVEKITLFTNEQGKNSGSGMIQFSNEAEMHAAVRDLNGAVLGTEQIRVSVARSKQQQNQQKGQGFGNFGVAGNNYARQAMSMQQMILQQQRIIQQQNNLLMRGQQQQQGAKGLHFQRGKGMKGGKSGKAFKAKIEKHYVSQGDLNRQLAGFLAA